MEVELRPRWRQMIEVTHCVIRACSAKVIILVEIEHPAMAADHLYTGVWFLEVGAGP
jgi:hypothetical protein